MVAGQNLPLVDQTKPVGSSRSYNDENSKLFSNEYINPEGGKCLKISN